MRSLVESTLRRAGERTAVPFAVRFPGGGEYRNRAEAPAFTLVIRNRGALARIAAFRHIGLLESYFDGDVDIKGKIEKARIPALPDLQEMAQLEGVQFIACRMTVDMMGFTQKDFIDGVIIQTAEEFLNHAKDCKLVLYT